MAPRRFVRRRKSVARRKRSFRRKLSRRVVKVPRNSLGSQYDSAYKAKCTFGFDLTAGALGQNFIVGIDWGTPNGVIANLQHLQSAPEFVALAAVFQEYRIVGFKVQFNFVQNPVAFQLSGVAGPAQFGGLIEMHKASFRNIAALPTTQQEMQAEYDYKNMRLGTRMSCWIRLDKYWKSVAGQAWLPVGSAYNPGNAGNASFTAFMIEHNYPANIRLGTFVVHVYVKFRGIKV